MLADGDVFAYQGASVSEFVAQFGTTFHLMADMEVAERHVTGNLKAVMKEIKAKKLINTLSCPTRHYWRHDVLPSYKGGRDKQYGVSGPICLAALKVWMSENYTTHRWKHMEADDVMGILATDPTFLPEYRKVIVSIDKDMKTIPDVWIFNPDKDYQPWFNTAEMAEEYFLSQAIGGDSTDGYSGCIGMSVESATAFLRDQWYWESYEHCFKSGPRKDTTELRWRKADPRSTWENIVSLYVKAGQTEEDALTNARVARICRASDYNQETGEVNLWLPN
jgi:DNA polymerase-1